MNTQLLIEIIENAGYECRSYSGRFMYGKECVAVSLEDTRGEVGFIADCLESMVNIEDNYQTLLDFIAIIRDMRTDSLGFGIIVYFPEQIWEGEDENE